jgi:hypothetical protein
VNPNKVFSFAASFRPNLSMAASRIFSKGLEENHMAKPPVRRAILPWKNANPVRIPPNMETGQTA